MNGVQPTSWANEFNNNIKIAIWVFVLQRKPLLKYGLSDRIVQYK